jgi:hypothetical protein
MIRPNPILQVYIAEKAATNRVVTAHRHPRSPPQGIMQRQIGNEFFNSLLVLSETTLRAGLASRRGCLAQSILRSSGAAVPRGRADALSSCFIRFSRLMSSSITTAAASTPPWAATAIRRGAPTQRRARPVEQQSRQPISATFRQNIGGHRSRFSHR